ncbi:MAG: D-aminoacylase [Chloroflexi bacterium]|nr:D-aminoacylase [Chloroflexota bacterium]
MPFDLVIRGGTLVDGTGAPGRPADVGVEGDRIAAVGDLATVDAGEAALVIDAAGRVVAPGFIDIHGHSDASVLVDGALVSHLAQGFTTQVSGNCGDSVAPVTPLGRAAIETSMADVGVRPSWTTFAEYLDLVDRQPLGPNVAFLAGHGTIRGAVLGPRADAPTADEARAMARHLEAALDAGAFGLSTGLIYAPGIHAGPAEVAALVAVAARRGALYATHMRNEAAGLFEALEEALATTRAAGEGARLQVSHLKAAARSVFGRGAEAVALLERARAGGLDVAADQYPYTAAATTLQCILPPALLALPMDDTLAALGTWSVRRRIRDEVAEGISGWENVAADPGWDGLVLAGSPAHGDWTGRSLAELGAELGRDPLDVACDILVDDRLASQVTIHCMDEADVEALLAVPWIAVCTDATGRRPGHPVLDAGVPHPRTYGSAPRVLGRYARERRALSVATAVAKLTAVPAERLGLAGRGTVREGAAADLVVFDPESVIDRATYEIPAVHPAGIDAVIVNGVVALRDGVETGARPGRLLRRA